MSKKLFTPLLKFDILVRSKKNMYNNIKTKIVSEKKATIINGEHIRPSELLYEPGDYCWAIGNEHNKWPAKTLLMNCPYCNVTTAYPQAEIKSFTNELLTIKDELTCAYNPSHKFKVHHGEILPVGIS